MSIRVVTYQGELTILAPAGCKLVEETTPGVITREALDTAVHEVVSDLDLYPPAQKTKAVGDANVTWRCFADCLAKRLRIYE